jgi:hypothetical protein
MHMHAVDRINFALDVDIKERIESDELIDKLNATRCILYVYVCVCICVYMCMYMYIYIYIYMRGNTQAEDTPCDIDLYELGDLVTFTCMCRYMCIHVCIYIYICIYTHVHRP